MQHRKKEVAQVSRVRDSKIGARRPTVEHTKIVPLAINKIKSAVQTQNNKNERLGKWRVFFCVREREIQRANSITKMRAYAAGSSAQSAADRVS